MSKLDLTPISAKDLEEFSRPRVLLAGGIGTGKTMQFCTLRGRKFCYYFDPNALETVKLAIKEGKLDPATLDFKEFLPDVEDLDIAAQTLRGPKDPGGLTDSSGRPVRDKPRKRLTPKLYPNWEEDFETRLEEGFFKDYDWVGFDSYTSWADMAYDRIMWLSSRLGKHPEQADHTAQMNLAKIVFRLLTAQGVSVFCTAHVENYKDDLTGAVHGRIMMTGRNRIRIPSMFSLIYATRTEEIKKATSDSAATFLFQTVPSREFPVVRNTIPGLNALEDVTIDWKLPIVGQGLQSLLDRA